MTNCTRLRVRKSPCFPDRQRIESVASTTLTQTCTRGWSWPRTCAVTWGSLDYLREWRKTLYWCPHRFSTHQPQSCSPIAWPDSPVSAKERSFLPPFACFYPALGWLLWGSSAVTIKSSWVKILLFVNDLAWLRCAGNLCPWHPCSIPHQSS